MARILNLTQHVATAEQISAGVVEPVDKARVQALLTFNSVQDCTEMKSRAAALTQICLDAGCTSAMIGGAPYFMGILEKQLSMAGIPPLYSFSVRESIDLPDGRKSSVFKHVDWIPGQAWWDVSNNE